MWKWDQSAGELSRDGKFVAKGYAGNGRGKNNPSMQATIGVGPVPQGKWKIGPVYNHQKLGPAVMNLDPKPGTNALGRSAFRIHGDSIAHPGEASHGCIILPRFVRDAIARSPDRDLEVVE